MGLSVGLDVSLKRIKVLDKRLRAQARGMTEVRRLMTVPGIGPITALAYRASMGAGE